MKDNKFEELIKKALETPLSTDLITVPRIYNIQVIMGTSFDTTIVLQ
ncbi:hypothetical protein EV204_1304 [Tissierella praeacuta]|nr:hypothetical protein [Tissierella praeacuta]TCU64167.1 hypothetical protein EV204_1304 [Tissierella praeacuta]